MSEQQAPMEKFNWHKISSLLILIVSFGLLLLWLLRPVDYTDDILNRQIMFKQSTFDAQEVRDLLADSDTDFDPKESCFVFTKGNMVAIVSEEYYFIAYDRTSINAGNSFAYEDLGMYNAVADYQHLAIGGKKLKTTKEILQRFEVDIARMNGE